jgi:hypothetical protein
LLTDDQLASVKEYACRRYAWRPYGTHVDQDHNGHIFVGSDYAARELAGAVIFDRQGSESVTLTIEEIERCI